MFRTSPRPALFRGKTGRSARRAVILHKSATTLDWRAVVNHGALVPSGWVAHGKLTVGERRLCKPASWLATTQPLAPRQTGFAVSNAALLRSFNRP